LLLREFVVRFRIFAAHSAGCPKCNQVSAADSNRSHAPHDRGVLPRTPRPYGGRYRSP
jgi:hypothetical protein